MGDTAPYPASFGKQPENGRLANQDDWGPGHFKGYRAGLQIARWQGGLPHPQKWLALALQKVNNGLFATVGVKLWQIAILAANLEKNPLQESGLLSPSQTRM